MDIEYKFIGGLADGYKASSSEMRNPNGQSPIYVRFASMDEMSHYEIDGKICSYMWSKNFSPGSQKYERLGDTYVTIGIYNDVECENSEMSNELS